MRHRVFLLFFRFVSIVKVTQIIENLTPWAPRGSVRHLTMTMTTLIEDGSNMCQASGLEHE